MNKKFILGIGVAAAAIGFAAFLGAGGAGSKILWEISNNGTWLLPLVIVSAAIDSINPCAFSVLLLTIAFLTALGATRGKILRIGGSFIAGISLVYILIGLGLLQALHLFNTPHFVGKVAALVLVAFGAINLLNEFFPSFPIKFRIPSFVHRPMATLMEKGSAPAVFVLGGLVGLCEFPCTGGPYLMILGLLHDSATYVKGFGYLLLYNAIFILPLFLVLLIASAGPFLEKIRKWQKDERPLMRFGAAVAMIALGLFVFLFF